MKIKIVQNGMESEWFDLTKKLHRALIEQKPDAAIVHIADLYPGSPDGRQIVQLEFELFTVLTREFTLEQLRQDKQDERHVDADGMESQAVVNYCLSQPDLDERYIKAERAETLAKAISELTPTQRHRLYLLAEGKSIREISKIEHCRYNAALESIHSAKRKIQKILKGDWSKRGFLSD